MVHSGLDEHTCTGAFHTALGRRQPIQVSQERIHCLSQTVLLLMMIWLMLMLMLLQLLERKALDRATAAHCHFLLHRLLSFAINIFPLPDSSSIGLVCCFKSMAGLQEQFQHF